MNIVPVVHAQYRSYPVLLSVYIIDGASGCTSKLDLGERSNSMTLADDILGNGKMSLLHCTMSGLCFCLASEAPYSPLNAW